MGTVGNERIPAVLYSPVVLKRRSEAPYLMWKQSMKLKVGRLEEAPEITVR
jgi:hypothetical protein